METIRKKYILSAFIALAMPAWHGLRASDAHLDSLIRIALAVSPKIAELKAQRTAARDAIPAESNLPDPMVTLGFMDVPVNTFSFSQEPMTGKAIGVSQAFPFPGALASRARGLAVDTAVLSQEIQDAENEIIEDVKQQYFKLIDVRLSLRATDSIKQLLKSIQEAVNAKYAVATASQQDVLKIDLELTATEDKLDDLHGKEADILSRLNAYLFRDARTDISNGDLPAIDSMNITASQIMDSAMLHSPMLLIPQLKRQQAALQAETFKYEYYPEFTASAQYLQRDRLADGASQSDLLSGTVGISIPLNYGGKVSAEVQEAQAMEESYREQYNAAMQHHASHIGAYLSRLQALQARVRLQRDGLLPQAQANLAASVANYQVGKIDFLNVIDAEKMLYDIEITLYDLQTEYLERVAHLEYLAGARILQ